MREAEDSVERVENEKVEWIFPIEETHEKEKETLPPFISIKSDEDSAQEDFSETDSSFVDNKGTEESQSWRERPNPFTKMIDALKSMKPLTEIKVRQWMEQFLHLMEKRKRKEVTEEKNKGQVSIKLGLMTGKKELVCDFCEVCDHFYPGAVFADVYVNGRLQWMMCPNCLLYCKEQANGSLEQNIRARFHKLAHRLEKSARQARSLAIAEDFRTPSLHEWEAWETASYAVQEVAATNQRWDP